MNGKEVRQRMAEIVAMYHEAERLFNEGRDTLRAMCEHEWLALPYLWPGGNIQKCSHCETRRMVPPEPEPEVKP
jgi:hypothetical protein